MLNFLPRDEKYFDRFNEMAVRIREAAQILDGFFQGKSTVATAADSVKRLEHVMDLIDGTVRRVSLFRIERLTPLSQSLCRLIVTTTGELVEAVSALRSQKGVMPHCIRIKQLENEADVVYHEAIGSLFAEN